MVLNLLNGMPEYEAYIQAGYAVKGARANASRLIAKDSFQQRLKALQVGIATKTTEIAVKTAVQNIMTAEERKVRLTVLANEDNATQYGYQRAPNISAIAELNKMAGDYAPEKHAVLGNIVIEVVYKGD
ncbi:hypothetical protein LCGC14_1253240 [marine sediment metagenome]|uniref:Uncharacterized protein n=1 Tax=marine sediment metagenome TaxID=412755 RepID=A0A0F9NJG5_9ZZZZ